MAMAGGIVMMTTDMGINALKNIPRKYVNDARKTKPPIYPAYMTKITSTEFMEEWTEMGGFGDVPLRDEGDGGNMAKPDYGNVVRMQPESRHLGFAITRKDKKWNKVNKIERASKALTRAAMRTMERIAAVPFNIGFTTGTGNIGSDGQPLFSAAHVRLNGTTVSNIPGTPVDLNAISLEAALVSFMVIPDNDGSIIDLRPKYLVVHPNELPNAMRLTKAMNFYSGTTGASPNNYPNAADTGVTNSFVTDYNLVVVANPYFTDVDAWFLLAEKNEHGVVLVENEALFDDMYQDDATKDYVYSIEFSQISGHNTDVGVYGSVGG